MRDWFEDLSFWEDYGSQAAVLFFLVLLIFGRVVGHPFVIHDDPQYVYENPHVVSGVSLVNTRWALVSLNADVSYWHPLTWFSHQLDSQLFGLRAGLHHLTSVWIHSINAALLLAVLRCLQVPAKAAFFTAAGFALHPLHVESVAWVAERKDVLYAMFWLGALAAWIRYRTSAGWKWCGFSLGLFICGLASKPSAVSLPVLLLLMELSFWPRAAATDGAKGLSNIQTAWLRTRPLLPFFLLSLAWTGLTLVAQSELGAVASLKALPISARCDGAAVGYASYLWKFFAPTGLAVSYVRSEPYRLSEILLSYSLLGAISWWAWAARNLWIGLGLGWFLVTLLPNIGLVQAGAQSMADRYSYIPIVGLLLAAAGAWRDWGRRFVPARMATVCAVCVLAGWGMLSVHQLGFWKDSVSLFERAVAVNPDNWLAQLGLGTALTEERRFSEAMVHLERAAELPGNAAETQRRLGICYLWQGDLPRARTRLERALELNPRSAETCFLLAGVLAEAVGDDSGRAAELAKRGLALRPDLRLFERVCVERAFASGATSAVFSR